MNRTQRKHLSTVIRMVFSMAMFAWISPASAATIVKDNNTSNLNLAVSWVGGVVPGSNDVAQWDSTVTGANTVVLGADQTWSGARILNPGGTAQINVGNTLTLGASGVDMSAATKGFTLNCPLVVGADQSWNAGGQQFSAWGSSVNMAGHQVTIVTGSKIQFKCPIIGTGTLIANGGTTQLSNGTTASNTTVVAGGTATLTFDSASGAVTGIRAQNAKLDGGTLGVSANTAVNTIDYVTNALTVETRLSILAVTPATTHSAQFRAGSFARNPGAQALFAGANLGVNPYASSVSNNASIWFDAPPTLLGGGFATGTTTNGILVGIIGDTLVAGNGLDATGGLVTYDPVNGVRLLDPVAEYATSISSGQSQLDNVRLSNFTGIVQTNTLNAFTTINSLSCIVTGNVSVTNCGITVNGTGALRLNSGTLYVVQTAVATNAGNAITLNSPVLDLNGQEGLIYFRKGQQNSQIGAGGLLVINSAITNGNGLTIYSSEPVDFGGATTNTYSGMTTVNGGNVRLYKSVPNVAIPGDLTINAGNVYTGFGNQIRDSASITINGGSLQFANSSGSGSGANETFSNLTMTGGSVGYASANNSVTVGMLGSATIIGATTFTGPLKGTVFVGNTVTLTNGGMWTVNRASTANNTFESVTTFSNGVAIFQPASGAYTPITITAGSGASINGGKLVIYGGNLVLVGNSANTNTVVISAPTGAGGTGVIALNGTRLFDIGNGAADPDLAVVPALTNGSTVGGLTKIGTGTLALNALTNSYTGPTTVSNGVLALNGCSVSPVTVVSNAVLTGTGYIATNTTALTVNGGGIVNPGSVGGIGTLTVTGNVAFASGGVLRVDLASGSNDLLAVSGNVTGSGPVLISTTTTNKGSWKVMSATGSIAPSFTTDATGLTAVKRNGNTEVWLMQQGGTAVFVR